QGLEYRSTPAGDQAAGVLSRPVITTSTEEAGRPPPDGADILPQRRPVFGIAMTVLARTPYLRAQFLDARG
ncbi:MAG: hypothetical protein QOD89_3045, partial [Bradyrhizobium sp.]|nr:hypothetical protein [Bradyrhizobium sp.]